MPWKTTLSIWWWTHIRYYMLGVLGQIIRALFSVSPVGGLTVQLFILLYSGRLSGSNQAMITAGGYPFVIGGAVGFLLAAGAIALYGHARSLSLCRLHGIRLLSSYLDEFRADIRSHEKSEDTATLRLEQFISKALVIIDNSMFPSKRVEMTFMPRVSGDYLCVTAWYPHEKRPDPEFRLSLDDPHGYARLAYATGRTVYVPLVKRNWGVKMTLARRPGALPQLKGVHRGLWKESKRTADYGSLICAPAMVLTNYSRFDYNSYGVLNIEHMRRLRTSAFNARDLYCACLAAGFLGHAIEIATQWLAESGPTEVEV